MEQENKGFPRHVAMIPDGNRRWARERNLPPFMGHWEGVKSAEAVIKAAFDMKLPYVTLWIGSVANLTERPAAEVKVLYEIFEQYFKKLLDQKVIFDEEIRVRVLGRWEEIVPESLKRAVRNVVSKTESHDKRNFTILLAYTGLDEMTAATKGVVADGLTSEEVTHETIKEHLWTKDLPPVDLVIRTGSAGDPHWSAGFMMWDAADAQLYFTDTTWPAFSPEEFKKALESYASRERRMGK